MSNVFDIKRFGKYFVYDLKNLRNRGGLALLVLSLMPLIHMFFYKFSSIFLTELRGSGPSVASRVAILAMAFIILFCIFGMINYGFITDKKTGSDWTLLPASAFEKFLSMMIISVVIVPAVFFTLYFISDWLVCLIDPSCGNTIRRAAYNFKDEIADQCYLNIPLIVYMGLICNILFFVLGAIVFPRKKFLYTFLVMMGLQMVFSFILSIVVGNFDFIDQIGNNMTAKIDSMTSHQLQNTANWMMHIFYDIPCIILAVLIFLRIKTIKH